MTKDSYLLAEEPAVDLAVAEAMAAELEEYLVKDDLYRTVIARTPRGEIRVRMTGGDLLSRLLRLQGERDRLTPEEQARLDALQQQVDSVIYSLRHRFHERLQREMKARLDSLRWFLDECREDRARCRAEFPFEMRNRQRIEEILKQLGDQVPQELTEALRAVDQRIRQYAQPSDFIWDERLKPIFTPHPYWYLYVRPA